MKLRPVVSVFAALLCLLGAAPATASAAPPYECTDANPFVNHQTKHVVSNGAGLRTGIVAVQDVGSNFSCFNDRSQNGQQGQGYVMSAFLMHPGVEMSTYGVAQAGIMRVDCNWECKGQYCPTSWVNDGIRYFFSLETWSSSSGALLETWCVALGPASGNAYKVRVDYNGAWNFTAYYDTDNNGTYDFDYTRYASYSWPSGGMIAGVFMPEKFDGGNTIGVWNNPSRTSGIKYRTNGSWYTPELVVSDCTLYDPPGDPTDTCSVNTSTDTIQSWGY